MQNFSFFSDLDETSKQELLSYAKSMTILVNIVKKFNHSLAWLYNQKENPFKTTHKKITSYPVIKAFKYKNLFQLKHGSIELV